MAQLPEDAGDRDAALARGVAERTLRCGVASVAAVAAGLGLRRFYRLALRGGPAPTVIARVEHPEDPAGRPAGVPPEPPLEPIRALLAARGLPVPARYGGDAAQGVELLEDVGDRTLCDAATAATPAERDALYAEAVELVPRLQAVTAQPGVAAFQRRLDDAHFAYKADLFRRYALTELGRDASAAEVACVKAAFAHVARVAAAAPQRLAHRDFQSRNLHVVPGRGLVMIDLQGALLAPPEYDLVCLLRDSYVQLGEDAVARLCERTRPALPDAPDAASFARRFDLLTITRKGKDWARFLYAARARGHRRYRDFVPATRAAVVAAAARAAEREPALRDFATLCRSVEAAACGA